MSKGKLDPYQTLGVGSGASDSEIRSAYRRLLQLHHPDHTGGWDGAARRFEEVQEASAEVRRLRSSATTTKSAPRSAASEPAARTAPSDPASDSRLADLERQVREAHLARERA